MKLIKPRFELVYPDGYDMENLFKFGEKIGRVCYRSEDKITPTSYEKFIENMKLSGHGSVLEHIPIYLKVSYLYIADHVEIYENNKYTIIKWVEGEAYISTNYRVIIENGLEDDLQYLTTPTEHHTKRITVHFTCSRDIWNEFIRHRSLQRVDDQDFSFMQESTRYCNYSKDKFGNEITFIIPSNMYLNEGEYEVISEYEREAFSKETLFLNSLRSCELNYLNLIDLGCTAQQARVVLPGATKTELFMTGFSRDWMNFFNLRNAKSAHPDAYELAHPLYEEFVNKGLI